MNEVATITAHHKRRASWRQPLARVPELGRPRARPGSHRRVATAGTATKVVIGRVAVASAGAGVLAALLLIAFVWPGVLHGTRAATDAFSPDRNKAVTSGVDAPTGITTARLPLLTISSAKRSISADLCSRSSTK